MPSPADLAAAAATAEADVLRKKMAELKAQLDYAEAKERVARAVAQKADLRAAPEGPPEPIAAGKSLHETIADWDRNPPPEAEAEEEPEELSEAEQLLRDAEDAVDKLDEEALARSRDEHKRRAAVYAEEAVRLRRKGNYGAAAQERRKCLAYWRAVGKASLRGQTRVEAEWVEVLSDAARVNFAGEAVGEFLEKARAHRREAEAGAAGALRRARFWAHCFRETCERVEGLPEDVHEAWAAFAREESAHALRRLGAAELRKKPAARDGPKDTGPRGAIATLSQALEIKELRGYWRADALADLARAFTGAGAPRKDAAAAREARLAVLLGGAAEEQPPAIFFDRPARRAPSQWRGPAALARARADAAVALLEAGDVPGAATRAREALATETDDGAATARAKHAAARVALARGDAGRAAELLKDVDVSGLPKGLKAGIARDRAAAMAPPTPPPAPPAAEGDAPWYAAPSKPAPAPPSPALAAAAAALWDRTDPLAASAALRKAVADSERAPGGVSAPAAELARLYNVEAICREAAPAEALALFRRARAARGLGAEATCVFCGDDVAADVCGPAIRRPVLARSGAEVSLMIVEDKSVEADGRAARCECLARSALAGDTCPVLGAVWGARRLDAEDAACYWLWAFVARMHREEPVSEDQVALATALMASGLGRRIKDKE